MHVQSKLEHVAVQKRDWHRIRDSIKVCRPPSPWLEGAGWAALGAGVGGVFAGLGLQAATPPEWLKSLTWVAAVALVCVSVICLVAARAAKRRAGDEAAALQQEMNQIEAECDQQRSL